MNSISIQSTVTSQVDGVRTVVSSNQNLNTSSSNFIAGSEGLTNGGWTAIPTSSLADVQVITILNDNSQYSASVISFATDNAGTNVIARILPGGQATIPWSGSLAGLYGKVTSAYPLYVATQTNGTCQFLLQQS